MFRLNFIIFLVGLCNGNKLLAHEILQAHNEYRAKHNSPPLVLYPTLNKFAEERAHYIAQSGIMDKRPDNPYGENVDRSRENCSLFQYRHPVDFWYNGVTMYNYGQDATSPKEEQFAQVVWKSTAYIGVGSAAKDGSFYVVVEYYPPGNVPGQYAQNIDHHCQDEESNHIWEWTLTINPGTALHFKRLLDMALVCRQKFFLLIVSLVGLTYLLLDFNVLYII